MGLMIFLYQLLYKNIPHIPLLYEAYISVSTFAFEILRRFRLEKLRIKKLEIQNIFDLFLPYPHYFHHYYNPYR